MGEFRTLMDTAGIDVVQVDVTRVGGLARSKRIGWDSAERHRLCVNHSYKTGINIAASLHFVAALPNAAEPQSKLKHKRRSAGRV